MPSSASDVKKGPASNTGGKAQKVNKSLKQEFNNLSAEVKKSFWDFVKTLKKFREIVKNNYELGRFHLGQGNLKDAQLRFKFVLWLEPRHVDAMYYLGATYLALRKNSEAADCFTKVLKLKPDFEEARYMLCVVSKGPVPRDKMPKRMPLSLAEEYFNSIAADYNTQQLQLLKYEGHAQLDNALRSCLTPGRVDYLILELGVGTGLCGPGIKDVASQLTGVDISSPMLEQAGYLVNNRQEKIYNALVKSDAISFLTDSADSSYDIIMSAGLFSYLGDLEPVFKQSSRVLREKGLLAFTADSMEGEGYQLKAGDTYFQYSKSYLDALAASNGFKELRSKKATIYADDSAWVCVYQKE